MRVTILGSGTLTPHAHRGSAAHLLEDGPVRLLLDCGSGVLQSLAASGRGWRGLTHVAITHFHTDHIGALPSLLWALRSEGPERGPLTVLGPVGLHARVEAMADAFGSFVLEPGFPLELVELDERAVWAAHHLRLECHPTAHTPESLAFRITGTGTVGYTGDTGPASGLGAFFGDVDLLISECAADDASPREGHLGPSDVATLARQSRCRLVVITHVYDPFDPVRLARAVEAAGIPGRCVPGRDGLTFEGVGSEAVDST